MYIFQSCNGRSDLIHNIHNEVFKLHDWIQCYCEPFHDNTKKLKKKKKKKKIANFFFIFEI